MYCLFLPAIYLTHLTLHEFIFCNSIRWGVPILKLIIMQFRTASFSRLCKLSTDGTEHEHSNTLTHEYLIYSVAAYETLNLLLVSYRRGCIHENYTMNQ